MALVSRKSWFGVSAALAIGIAATAGDGRAASAVPAGGANWTLVNQVYAAAGSRPEATAAAGQAMPETAGTTTAPAWASGWLSEIRGGVLKHSVAISTDTPKEGGVDGNLEVLFVSPDFMDIVWSPRPHIGASFSASADDTDQVYTGLTWEWMPWGPLFIDASFGFSVHNGRLHAEPGDTDTDQRREFGCRWLFRESIELDVVVAGRHSLSAMWDHISHGGVYDDENEGMDNVGVRYGYRF